MAAFAVFPLSNSSLFRSKLITFASIDIPTVNMSPAIPGRVKVACKEAKIANTTLGKDVIELMKAGVLTENSVGIMPIQKEMIDGIRHINEVKLFEISAVTMAANDQAMILDVKGNADREKILKKYDLYPYFD